MNIIKFKATRRVAQSCNGYRQIVKRGDLHLDLANTSDDVIVIYAEPDKTIKCIKIDCDKLTGEFSIGWSYNQN